MNEKIEFTSHDTSASIGSISSQLFSGFADPEYRHIYADERLRTAVPFQIRAIREQRGWKQAELGRRCGGKAQGWISKLEDPNYGQFTLKTLKEIARAFDCMLDVRFISFRRYSDDQDFRYPGDLQVNTYDEDARSTPTASTERGSVHRIITASVIDLRLGQIPFVMATSGPTTVRPEWFAHGANTGKSVQVRSA